MKKVRLILPILLIVSIVIISGCAQQGDSSTKTIKAVTVLTITSRCILEPNPCENPRDLSISVQPITGSSGPITDKFILVLDQKTTGLRIGSIDIAGKTIDLTGLQSGQRELLVCLEQEKPEETPSDSPLARVGGISSSSTTGLVTKKLTGGLTGYQIAGQYPCDFTLKLDQPTEITNIDVTIVKQDDITKVFSEYVLKFSDNAFVLAPTSKSTPTDTSPPFALPEPKQTPTPFSPTDIVVVTNTPSPYGILLGTPPSTPSTANPGEKVDLASIRLKPIQDVTVTGIKLTNSDVTISRAVDNFQLSNGDEVLATANLSSTSTLTFSGFNLLVKKGKSVDLTVVGNIKSDAAGQSVSVSLEINSKSDITISQTGGIEEFIFFPPLPIKPSKTITITIKSASDCVVTYTPPKPWSYGPCTNNQKALTTTVKYEYKGATCKVSDITPKSSEPCTSQILPSSTASPTSTSQILPSTPTSTASPSPTVAFTLEQCSATIAGDINQNTRYTCEGSQQIVKLCKKRNSDNSCVNPAEEPNCHTYYWAPSTGGGITSCLWGCGDTGNPQQKCLSKCEVLPDSGPGIKWISGYNSNLYTTSTNFCQMRPECAPDPIGLCSGSNGPINHVVGYVCSGANKYVQQNTSCVSGTTYCSGGKCVPY